MIASNNVNLSIDEKTTEITTGSLIEFIEEYRDEIAFENDLFHTILCDNEYQYKLVHSCLVVPSDFYEGIDLAFDDWWEAVLYSQFLEYDWDKKISFDELSESLYLKGVVFEKAPRNTEELHTLAEEFRIKLKYYKLSQWYKWQATECAEMKTKIKFFGLTDDGSSREWAESVIKEYGEEKLHIADFSEFGFQYGVIVGFDSAWHTLNSSPQG